MAYDFRCHLMSHLNMPSSRPTERPKSPPNGNVTEAWLKKQKPMPSRWDVRDKSGMIVRIEPTGSITFYTDYRLHKQRRLLKHGEFVDQSSIEEARKEHADTLARVAAARRGQEKARDPAAERDIRRAQAALGDTVKAFADIYMELHAKVKKRSWKLDQRIL